LGSPHPVVQQKPAKSIQNFSPVNMKFFIFLVLFVELVFSAEKLPEPEVRGKPKTCKNPKAKIGGSVMRGCSQATCMKSKKGAEWEECPMPATEESMNSQLASVKAGLDALTELIKQECGIPATPTFEPTTQTAVLIECPTGWTLYNNNNTKCFRLFPSKLGWNDAEAFCQGESQLGFTGHLASVHSTEENNFILKSFGKVSGWIGATDVENEGQWQWSDTSPFDYESWAGGEPNSFGGEEHCVDFWHLTAYGWNDMPCDRLLSPLCQLAMS